MFPFKRNTDFIFNYRVTLSPFDAGDFDADGRMSRVVTGKCSLRPLRLRGELYEEQVNHRDAEGAEEHRAETTRVPSHRRHGFDASELKSSG